MNIPFVSSSIKGKSLSEPSIETDVFDAAMIGDSAALGKLYDAYFDRIYRFIYYRTSHQQTAEDITEEVFIKVFRALPTLKGGPTKLSGWIFQIARNSVIDHYRKANPLVSIDEAENIAAHESDAIDALQLQSDQRVIVTALEKLSSEQQQVIRLRFLEGFEIAEIAHMLRKSEGNIRIIQFRALTELRTILKNHIRI